MNRQDKEAEATEELVVEASVPPTTTTTTTTSTITTTRAQPPAISLKEAAQRGDVAALAQHLQAQLCFEVALAVAWHAWRFFREGRAGAVFGSPCNIAHFLTPCSRRFRPSEPANFGISVTRPAPI